MQVFSIVSLCYLIILSLSDLRTRKIPNSVLLCFFITVFCSDLKCSYTQIPFKIISALCIFFLLFAISFFTKGLGMGDVKLGAVIAYCTGFFKTSIIFLIASLIGLIFCIANSNKVKRIPFVPFITCGFLFSDVLCRRLNGIF